MHNMYIINIAIIFVISFSHYSEGKPKIQNALLYLSQYGYLPPNSMGSNSLTNAKTFKKSLRDFQAFAGIPETGKLDRLTVKMMSSPRCGMPDKVGHPGRSKRYVTQGSRWRTKQLTYKISKYSKRLGRGETDRAIQDAFNLWSKYTDLTFRRSDRANIDIRFEEGSHGDNSPFDGRGKTLAHAYFPQFGGSTHFDDAESWGVGNGRGLNILQTAAHEFGHALGLSHSQTKQSLMAPFYNNRWTGDLYRDDIADMHGGKGGASPPSPRGGGSPRRFPRRRIFRRVYRYRPRK